MRGRKRSNRREGADNGTSLRRRIRRPERDGGRRRDHVIMGVCRLDSLEPVCASSDWP